MGVKRSVSASESYYNKYFESCQALWILLGERGLYDPLFSPPLDLQNANIPIFPNPLLNP